MAGNQKISDLTEQTDLSLIDGLAGYEGTSNVKISGPNIISAIPTIYSGDGTIGAGRVATITDFPKFSGDQGNPIGLEIENSRAGTNQSTHGAQLKLTARAGASSTISFYNGVGGGTSAPAMVIDSPAGIRYTSGSTYVNYHHSFNRGGTTPWYIGMTNSPLTANSPKLEMLLGGGGSNASFYTTKINGSSDFLYMFMSPGTAGRHIALGEYTNTGAVYKDFIRIDSSGNVGINEDVPTAKLQITGAGSSSSTKSLFVRNGINNSILEVRDDRYVTITGDNSVDNFFILKNDSTWTMLDAGDAGSNNGQLRIKSNNNNRFWFKANEGLSIGDNGAVTIDASAVLKADSTTKGFLPPRMTTVQKNAIASPASGLVLFDTDENNLQYFNGNWIPTGVTPNSQLLAMTEITASAAGNVTHDIHNYLNTPADTLTAVNFNSDGTNRYAKISFTSPYSGKAKIVFTSYAYITGGTFRISIGLHDRATSTTTPVYGWFMLNEDEEPGAYRIIRAEWIVDVFQDEGFAGYVQAIASGSGAQFIASNYQASAWSNSNHYACPALVEAYSIENISITTNPTG